MSEYFELFLKKNNLMFNQKFQVLDYDEKYAVGNGAKFWIADNKLHCDNPEMNTRLIMLELFAGNCSVKQLPYYSTNGDVYFYIYMDGSNNQGVVSKGVFYGNLVDQLLRSLGKCYRTRNEAEEHLKEDVNFLLKGR